MDVIVLSSSEDEIEIEPSKKKNDKSKIIPECEDIDNSLSDLPKINFNDILGNNSSRCSSPEKDNNVYDIHEVNNSKTKATSHFLEEDWLSFDIQNSKAGTSKETKNSVSGSFDANIKGFNLQDGSQSDSDCDSQNNVDYWEQYQKGLKNKYNDPVDVSSDEDILKEIEQKDKKRGKKRPATSKAEALEEKKRKQEERQQEKIRKQEERQQEKLRKQEEAAKQKALKELNKKKRLQFNNSYNLKLMEIVVDENIKKYDFFTEFLVNAGQTEVPYNFQSQIIPKSITWNRTIENNYINERHEVCYNDEKINEDQMMIIWDAEETVNHIFNNTFISTISDLKQIVPNKKITLVIYQVDSYFKYMKNVQDRATRDNILNIQTKKKSKTKADRTFGNFPKISRKMLDECLVEIQLSVKVNSRLIEKSSEMVILIYQYTRSLAQRPAKLEKKQRLSQFSWYILGDKRDTVKVDKDGNGLKRLWQRQLCQFKLVSLEISEAVVSNYKSPLQLMEAYDKCSPDEGQKLLKDICIRRTVGLSTTSRKVGPALSKKVYKMFTAEDGDLSLQ